MTKVFVSYKHSESATFVGLLYDRLCLAFGQQNIFLDVTQVAGGEDFAVAIDRAIADTDVLLLLIGESWLTPTPAGSSGAGIDWVRVEIEASLRNNLFILPLLLDGIGPDAITKKLGPTTPVARFNALPLRKEFLPSDANAVVSDILRVTSRPDWQERERARCLRIRIQQSGGRTRVIVISNGGLAESSQLEPQPGLFLTLLEVAVSQGFGLDALQCLQQLIFPTEFRQAITTAKSISFDSDSGSAYFPIELICQSVESLPGRRLRRFRAVVRNAFEPSPKALRFITPSNYALALYIENPLHGDSADEQRVNIVEAELARLDSSGQQLVVNRVITADMAHAMAAMFERNYRVVYLSASACMRRGYDGRPSAGLGRPSSSATEYLLTAREFESLQYVPRLVCVEVRGINDDATAVQHIDSAKHPRWSAYNSLCAFADMFAPELLRAGVSFVVVYSASDIGDKAVRFVSLLWRRLLKGDTFGAAVTSATAAFCRDFPSKLIEYPPLCFGDPTLTFAPPSSDELAV